MNNQSESSPLAIGTTFYNAFKERNSAGMNSLYHKDLKFEDPAFGKLSHLQTCAMWEMLCESAKDLVIDFSILDSNDKSVTVKWIADYTFSKSNRLVHNEIVAIMHIEEGLIINHIDSFNLHKWARQALGLQGLILGGTSFFRKKLQAQTNRQLEKYIKRSSAR